MFTRSDCYYSVQHSTCGEELPEKEARAKLGTSVPILLELDETGIASRERNNPVEDDF